MRIFLRITVNFCHVSNLVWGGSNVDGLDLAFPLERVGKNKWIEKKSKSLA